MGWINKIQDYTEQKAKEKKEREDAYHENIRIEAENAKEELKKLKENEKNLKIIKEMEEYKAKQLKEQNKDQLILEPQRINKALETTFGNVSPFPEEHRRKIK